jgi:protein MpaA
MSSFRIGRILGYILIFCAFCVVAGARDDQLIRASPAVTGAAAPQTVVYGTSRHGRPLTAYVLGSGPNTTFVLGGMHGNELITPLVVERLRAFLSANPGNLDGCTVVLVPRVNPDGDAAHTRANAAGVDLNRNFPFGWKPHRTGIRLSPGSGPLSEPEARALVSLLDKYHPSKVVDIHQPLDALVGAGAGGRALAMAMKPENHFRFTTNVGYPTPGSFGSYLSHVRHIACVTLELPRESVDKAWQTNKQALLIAIHYPSR